MAEKLTAVVLTHNEERHIAACIESLRFADAVLVFDSFSDDGTVTLARQCGARVEQHPFADFAAQRNAALEKVGEGWVLFVDADERVTPVLTIEVRAAMASGSANGFRIPRYNTIFGRRTTGAGWYPDYQTRLLRVGHARYDPAVKVHEVVLVDGPVGSLNEPLVHFNYETVAQFHEKQRRYMEYEAEILFAQGVRPKLYTPLTQPVRHFIWRFFTLRGWRDGLHGLRLSLLMSWYEFRKMQRLAHRWRKAEKQ